MLMMIRRFNSGLHAINEFVDDLTRTINNKEKKYVNL